MKIRPVGTELFHADGTDMRKLNSRFSQFCVKAPKKYGDMEVPSGKTLIPNFMKMDQSADRSVVYTVDVRSWVQKFPA